MDKTQEFLKEYRAEANFINNKYGLSDLDHFTALDPGHIYDLMREFAIHKDKLKLLISSKVVVEEFETTQQIKDEIIRLTQLL